MQINPYQAPKADVIDSQSERVSFKDMSTKDLKKLENHSNNIRSLGSLWLLGVLFATFISIISDSDFTSRVIYFSFSLLFVIPIYSCWVRPSWGRTVGIIFSSLSLLGIPIGTIIGAIGLHSFMQGKQLFGSDRYLHSEIMKEFKHRKSLGID